MGGFYDELESGITTILNDGVEVTSSPRSLDFSSGFVVTDDGFGNLSISVTGGGSSYTFTNMLGESAGVVTLGGDADRNTVLNLQDFDFEIAGLYSGLETKLQFSRATSGFDINGMLAYSGKTIRAINYVGDASAVIGGQEVSAGIGIKSTIDSTEGYMRYDLDPMTGRVTQTTLITDDEGAYSSYKNSTDSIETYSTEVTPGNFRSVEISSDSSTPRHAIKVIDETGDENELVVGMDTIKVSKLISSRDDTPTTPQENVLYTDGDGELKSAPFKQVSWYGAGTGPSATTGRYVSPTIHTGGTTGAGLLGNADKMFFFPFSPSMLNIKNMLGIRHVALDLVGAGVIKYLVYEFDISTGCPTNLIETLGTYTCTATRTAFNVAPSPSPLVLDYNKYYTLAIVANNATARVWVHTNGTSMNPLLGYTASGTSIIQCTYLSKVVAGSFASPPTSFAPGAVFINSSASNVLASPLIIV